MIETISKYLLAHEKLLLGIGLLALSLFLGDKYINYSAKIADEANNKAQQAAQQQQVVVNNLTQALQNSAAANQALMVQLAASNAQQEAEIQKLKSDLAKQQQQVKVEPLPELATQWDILVDVPDGIKNTSSGLIVTELAARSTVSELLQVPVLTKTVSDQQVEISNGKKAIASQTGELTSANNLVAALNVQIVDNKKACVKEVADVKAQDRKSKVKWFVIGYVAGVASRGVLKLVTGY